MKKQPPNYDRGPDETIDEPIERKMNNIHFLID